MLTKSNKNIVPGFINVYISVVEICANKCIFN